jgi:hypothetical protein
MGIFCLLVFKRGWFFPKNTRCTFLLSTNQTQQDCIMLLGVCADAMNHVLELRETSVFPNSEDLHGAAIALVRLQDTYQLNVTELADGHYNGVDHSKGQGFLFHFLFSICFFLFFFK